MNNRNVAAIARQGPVSPAKFGHVVLRTQNLAPMREWYLEVLNAHIAYENEMVAFMTYDDEHHRVGIVQLPGLTAGGAPAGSPGLEHLSFTYADLGQLLATFQRLKAAKIEPFWTINHGPTISMYYRDPDGNKVELQFDVFATSKDASDFIEQHYPENFMGIIFDPEQLVRDFESGKPIAELVKRPKLPPGKTPWDMHRG